MPVDTDEAIRLAHQAICTKLSVVDWAEPGLESARSFVAVLDSCVAELNHAAAVPREVTAVVSGSVMLAAVPVYLEHLHRRGAQASVVLSHIWADHAVAFGILQGELGWLPPKVEPVRLSPEDYDHVIRFNQVVGERLRQRASGDQARGIVRRLASVLDLSLDEVGRMFDVKGETVRRWERGLSPVPAQRLATLTVVDAALERLLRLFRPDRLSLVIRRPAELFDGERAVDWILRGRIGDVADRYDRVLAYQA